MYARVLCAVGAILLFLTAGGCVVAAGGSAPAVIRAASGHPVRTERTYRFHGYVVPVGACAAVVHGRVWVLGCQAPQLAVYRRELQRGQARVSRLAARVRPWPAAFGAVMLLGWGMAWAAWRASRTRRARRAATGLLGRGGVTAAGDATLEIQRGTQG